MERSEKNAKNRGTHDPPRPAQTCRKGSGRSLALWEIPMATLEYPWKYRSTLW